MLNELELTKLPEDFFTHYNEFMLSGDTRVFNKLVARTLIMDQVKDVPGDIVECGVFKGTGIYTFLKLNRIFNANSSKQVIGFDFFNTSGLISSIENEADRKAMGSLFEERGFGHSVGYKETLERKIMKDGFKPGEFKLVEGDVSVTTKTFSEENPGFKISLLYLDLDLGDPTYDTLVNLWSNVTKGGIIIFDEYGYHKWSESKGVDRFCDEMGLMVKSLNYLCPTAYIQKS